MKRLATVINLVGVIFALSACQPTGSRPAVSLEEAKQITAQFGKTAFQPPPRTVDDVLAVLDEPKGYEVARLNRHLRVADAECQRRYKVTQLKP